MEGLIFGGAYIWRERFASKSSGLALQLEGNFTVFALFYFVFEGNFRVQAPGAGLIYGGAIQRTVFLRYKFGGAYIWRGLYMEGLIFGILR